MSNDKKYVGSGKAHPQFDLVNISVKVTDPAFKAAIFEYNGEKYVKLTVAARKEADKYGKTHTVYIDEYDPEAKRKEVAKAAIGNAVFDNSAAKKIEEDDLPF